MDRRSFVCSLVGSLAGSSLIRVGVFASGRRGITRAASDPEADERGPIDHPRIDPPPSDPLPQVARVTRACVAESRGAKEDAIAGTRVRARGTIYRSLSDPIGAKIWPQALLIAGEGSDWVIDDLQIGGVSRLRDVSGGRFSSMNARAARVDWGACSPGDDIEVDATYVGAGVAKRELLVALMCAVG